MKWKPSATQRREFAERMADPEQRAAALINEVSERTNMKTKSNASQTTEPAIAVEPVLPAVVFYNWAGCSRWTNSSRSMAIHISKNNDGEPICGKQYSGGTLRREEFNLNEVTCKKCLSLYGR